jgi:trehalose synthase
MAALELVPVGPMDLHRFETVLTGAQYATLLELIKRAGGALEGRVIWNLNSTTKGGGVVELLRPLLGYARGAGVDARWVVVGAQPEFFEITKRLHNRLHGFDGDGGSLGAEQRAVYDQALAAPAAELSELVHPTDVVILHDPQTAGLVDAVRRSGAIAVWRCHVGRDHANHRAHEAWDFLRGYVLGADALVFSRRQFIWDGLPAGKISIIQPSIDAFSAKNQQLSRSAALAILSQADIIPGHHEHGTFVRGDGSPGRVDRQASMVEERRLSAEDPVVAQISRWDRLKDPLGVMKAFARFIGPSTAAHLVLAGPATESVADDPESRAVFAAVRDAWRRLPPEIRERVHLATLPMDDEEENAAIVNALQRHSTVVLQKSLAEGFGLTVAEAMWKKRPVVASGIGGIQDQIVDGESGMLISDPHDLRLFGQAVTSLLSDTERAKQIGHQAHRRVRDCFLGPRQLGRYFDLIERLLADSGRSGIGA